MPWEPVFAYLHFASVFSLVAVVVAELSLYRPQLDQTQLKRLAQLDLIYLFLALAMLGTGFSRAIWFGKGWTFYSTTWLFWAKVAFSVAVGTLSVPPTIHFLRLRKVVPEEGAFSLPRDVYVKIRACIVAQLGLAAAMPLFAVLMARGYGH